MLTSSWRPFSLVFLRPETRHGGAKRGAGFLALDVWKEGLMKAIYKTGLETLAVLWGLQG
jgi:hypothetical protein